MDSDITSSLAGQIDSLEGLLASYRNDNPDSLAEFVKILEFSAETAGSAGLAGLQDICLLLQQNIQDQSSDKIPFSDQQLDLLHSGLQSMRQYIAAPSNATFVEQLLALAKHSCWQSPLSGADAHMLEDMLLTEPATPADRDASAEPPAAAPVTTATGNYRDRLEQLDTLLRQPLADAGEQATALNRTLETLADQLGEAGQFMMQDLCLFLNENFIEISARNDSLNDAQNTLLAAWFNLMSRLLQQPEDKAAASAIINNLQNEIWAAPISDADARVIASMLGVAHGDENDADEDETSVAAPAQYEELLQPLQQLCTAQPPDLQQIAALVEALGVMAGDQELLGFQDICLILQENLQDAVADQLTLSAQQQAALAGWPQLARQYLQNPQAHEGAQTLIGFLQADNWCYPLAEDNAALLREMLGAETPAAAETTATAGDDNKAARIEDLSAQPCPVSTELVEMLLTEIRTIKDNVRDTADKLAAADTQAAVRQDQMAQLMLKIERFGSASQAAELAGLYQVCTILLQNLKQLATDQALAGELATAVANWPGQIEHYLNNLGQQGIGRGLSENLSAATWPKALDADVVPALSNLLDAPYPVAEEDSREQRQATAMPDDISIAIPDDINQELLDGLLQELPAQTENFSAAIQSLIDGSGELQEVEKAQRIAHTVKGAANTVGIRGIANLTHLLEDILIMLNKHNRLPSNALSTTLMNAADCLEEMSEALLEQNPAPDNAQATLQEVLDWVNRLEQEGIDSLESDMQPAAPAAERPAGDEQEGAAAEDESASVAMLRVPANLIDDMIRILGETIILTTQLQENVRRSNSESEALFKHYNLIQGLISELDKQVELRGIAFNQQRRAVNQSEVESEIFDPLELEQYNELHTVTNRLTEAAVDSFELNRNIDHDLHELDDLLFDQSRLHRQVQELVMKTRMVPIKSITPRLQRSVRQTCRTTGKAVNLHLRGSDTLVDSDVLNNLLDPLMHMLRNAIDHGIEDREIRISHGKNPEGQIQLDFAREGTQIVVRCRDDGAGLNRDAIRLQAIKRGIIEPADKPPEHELDRMILLPGFSTRRETTQVSGRGIGMDVVYSQILAMKGSIHIESEPGNGCLFELRLPVTLISSHSLLIRQRDQVLAISNRGIIQILHPSDSEIISEGEDMQVRVSDNVYDAINLESIINLPGDRRIMPRETRPALLVQEEDINRVVFMQEITDVKELVIKPMGVYMKGIPGVPGATILGDGSVVPVLDIPELLRSAGKRHFLPGAALTGSHIPRALPTALVVDDSLSARRSLAQVIKDAGYDVRTAKDGLEAVDIIKKKRPDILLVDLEMPRMNGMELSSHVRNNRETANIPIIMVTSRSTDKHREQARAAGVNIYLTKPFSDDELLDHVSNLLVN